MSEENSTFDDNKSLLLTGISIVASIAGLYFAYRAGKKMAKNDKETAEMSKKEKAIEYAKALAPAVGLEAVSIACSVGSTATDAAKIAGLTAMAGAMGSKLKEQTKAIIADEPEERLNKIKERISKANKSTVPAVVKRDIDENKSKKIFYDPILNFKFEASRFNMIRAISATQAVLDYGCSFPDGDVETAVAISDIYYNLEVELPPDKKAHADKYGWTGDYIQSEGVVGDYYDLPCSFEKEEDESKGYDYILIYGMEPINVEDQIPAEVPWKERHTIQDLNKELLAGIK